MAQPYSTEDTTGSKMQYLLSTYYERKFLTRLTSNFVLYPLMTKTYLPAGEGKIVKWSRYSNWRAGIELTEGSAPSPVAMSAANVTATLTQLGGFIQSSDLLSMTCIDRNLEGATQVLADGAAFSVDTYILRAMIGLTGGSVSSDDVIVPAASSQVTRNGLLMKYFNDRILISGVVAANVATLDEVRQCVRNLRKLDAKPFSDGYYVGVIHPQVAFDIMGDTATAGWADWQKYTTPEVMYKGEIGRAMGVRFIESTNMFRHSSGAGASTSAYYTPIFGPDAVGVVEIGGENPGINLFVKGPNQYDTNNPLNQWSTVGYKITFAARVLNPSCGVILVTGSNA